MAQQNKWDKSVDLLVIGSGAGGLSAGLRASALGSEVLIIEKGDAYGGSTAMSGGVCWVPNNPYMAKLGLEDNPEDALTYLTAITNSEVSQERLKAYMDGALRALEFFESETWVRFDALKLYTDYYPEAPGGRSGGRSMESRPFDGAKLGEDLRLLRKPHPQSQILGKFGITAAQAHTLLQHGLTSTLMVLWCFLLYALRYPKRRKYGRDTHLVTGNALIARLRLSLKERGVPLWLHTGAQKLIHDPDTGRVVGAEIDHEGTPMRIEARQGVVLAAGGFSRNLEMRKKYQRTPITDTWSAGNLDNMGDGIRMGMEAGGSIDLMKEAWWTPVTMVPRQKLAWVLVVEKNLPGTIFVNAQGRRFANEAAPYIDVVVDMYEAEESPAVPCSMIFDATYRYKYPVGPIAPGYAMPDSRVPRKL
ncbi:MAG: FAD-binding protein, partial [Myxococcota bacterium]